jgi:hypothetical protein
MLARGASVCRTAAGAVLRGRTRLAVVGCAGPHARAAFGDRHASTATASNTSGTDCPFSILKIEPTEEFSKIKRAYFEAASRCHPDVMPASALSTADPRATAQEFLLVTAAYQALQDPWIRASLAKSQTRAEAARTQSTAGQTTTDRKDSTWRREQQEMEWCVFADAILHPSDSVPLLQVLENVAHVWIPQARVACKT